MKTSTKNSSVSRAAASAEQVTHTSQPQASMPAKYGVLQAHRTPVIQRFDDVNTLYNSMVKTDAETEKLNEFSKIQHFLANKSRVKPHLKELDRQMKTTSKNLSSTLQTAEKGNWSDALPTLIGFVPPPMFQHIVQQGEMFEDTVAEAHGVQTHRIQWFLIAQEAKQNTNWLLSKVTDLYKEALDAKWKRPDGKYMWDHLVDGLGSTSTKSDERFDFTKPNNLEAYLSQDKKQLGRWYARRKSIATVADGARSLHGQQTTVREEHIARWHRDATQQQKDNARLHVGYTSSSRQQDVLFRERVGDYEYCGFVKIVNDAVPTVAYKVA